MAAIVNYINDSFTELKNHVTWPSYAEAQKLMVIVAVFSVLFSLAIWGIDELFSGVIKQYFNLIKG